MRSVEVCVGDVYIQSIGKASKQGSSHPIHVVFAGLICVVYIHKITCRPKRNFEMLISHELSDNFASQLVAARLDPPARGQPLRKSGGLSTDDKAMAMATTAAPSQWHPRFPLLKPIKNDKEYKRGERRDRIDHLVGH